MKQILLFSPSNADGCAFYRGIGPLSELRHYDIVVKQCPRQLHWGEISTCDIGFMQRPYSQKHVQIAKMIKQQVPLWIDYDDDLFNVPESNPSYELYSDPKTIESLEKLKLLADVITVSTKGVQESFGGTIVPNAYNDYRLSTNYVGQPNKKKRVLWRGTNSHVNDLLSHKEELNHILQVHIDFDFVFFGFNPWMLDCSNVTYIPGQDIYSYFKTIELINPDILIVPLEDNKLNRAKSNIAWLEAARFGTRTVAPSFSEWFIGDMINYHTHDFVNKFREAAWGERIDYGWRVIQNGLLLSQTNKTRLEIIKQILS